MKKHDQVLLWVARVIVGAVLILFAVLKIYEWIVNGFGTMNLCKDSTQALANIFGIALVMAAVFCGASWITKWMQKEKAWRKK